MLFRHESIIYPADIVIRMIDYKKSHVHFLPTLKIEGAADINFEWIPSIWSLGETYAGHFLLKTTNTPTSSC